MYPSLDKTPDTYIYHIIYIFIHESEFAGVHFLSHIITNALYFILAKKLQKQIKKRNEKETIDDQFVRLQKICSSGVNDNMIQARKCMNVMFAC